jgi:hypothetical protein
MVKNCPRGWMWLLTQLSALVTQHFLEGVVHNQKLTSG